MEFEQLRNRLPRQTVLTAALMAAIAVGGGSAIYSRSAVASGSAPALSRISQSSVRAVQPNGGATYQVTSCADDGSAGTLRYVIEHNAVADSDTVDLSSLPCSTITLTNGQIVIPQSNFSLVTSKGVTIDAQSKSRVIEHIGTGGQLFIQGVNLSNGYIKYNSSTGVEKGGCLLSNGNISLTASALSNCHAINVDGEVLGGAMYVAGQVQLTDSSITHGYADGVQALGGGIFNGASITLTGSTVRFNTVATTDANNTSSLARGGGIFSEGAVDFEQSDATSNRAIGQKGSADGGGVNAQGGLTLFYSVITGNTATGSTSGAGGVYAKGRSYIFDSTIDHNQSVNNSALVVTGGSSSFVNIDNSTISTNAATTGSSTIFASIPINIHNTTIAFNTSAGTSAGLYLYPGSTLLLESTIIANNKSTGSSPGFDVVTRAAITGSHNLVRAPQSAPSVPGDTLIGFDPLLEPLAVNGNTMGSALTHALAPTSPAIDRGTDTRTFSKDERGYPRSYGLSTDIGAYEWQGDDTDTIFKNGFEVNIN